MAFGATITITINSVAKVLNRVNQDGYSSEWLLLEATGAYVVKLRNSKRVDAKTGQEMHRHNVEMTYTVYATSTTPEYVRKYYAVSEFPKETDLAQAKLEHAGVTTFYGTAVTNGIYEWMS